MSSIAKVFYAPTLRLKQGEYRALCKLAPDVASRILPRLVVPPPQDRDPELGRVMSADEIVHLTGQRIAKHWQSRPSLLETRFLFKKLGEEECAVWLPKMFRVARAAEAEVVPIVGLPDATGMRAHGFRRAISRESAGPHLAIRIQSGEAGNDLHARIRATLTELDVDPRHCLLLADFCDAEFSNVAIAADIVREFISELQSIAPWMKVIFQGTNYPETNPAAENATVFVPRNEWLAWKIAFGGGHGRIENCLFGDYGADCAKFSFRNGGGGPPKRHYRYATQDSWMVVRGSSTGTVPSSMQEVCLRIVSNAAFSGRRFSFADNYLYLGARGQTTQGSATTWREINTIHHVTRVVKDIGHSMGVVFSDINVSDPPEQIPLFGGL